MRDNSKDKYYWANESSLAVLHKGYIPKTHTIPQRVKEIAEEFERINGTKGLAEKFEDYVARGWYSLSSPIWANYGAGRGYSISCNGSYIPDSIQGIFDANSEVAWMSKMGAGTSAYFGDIRPKGSKISAGGVSDGPVRFMEVFETTTKIVSQNGTRRGSLAAYLPIEHPDILDFLEAREHGHAIQDLSIGVCIGDEYMEDIKKNKEASQKNKEIFARLISKKFNDGYPYILFKDTANRNKPQVYKDKGMEILASNLCVAPETLILTSEGHKVISELEGESVKVWNGKSWSGVEVKKTGENQKLLTVKLSDGKSLDCTEYHKWYVVNNYNDQRNGVHKEKRTIELKEGDKLIKFECPIVDGDEEFKYPYTHGAFCGDGTYEKGGRCRISLYGEKKNLVEFMDIHKDNGEDSSGRRNVVLPHDIERKFKVPHNSSVQTKLRWLEGLMDTDGTVTRNGTNEALQVCSVEPEFLKEVQLMVQTLGVNSKVTFNVEAGDRMMPDGRGGEKLYPCKDSYRLLISSNGLYQLSLLGFSPKRLKFTERLPQRDASQFVKVESVTDHGRRDDTFCVNEPKEHKAVFNGILTGQCNEIMLPSSEEESFVCCLSSLNLLHYDEWKDTDAVELMTAFLDSVIQDYIDKTEGVHEMRKANRFAKRHRAIGVGVLGWHSYLQSNGISFESMEAKFLTSKIFKNIEAKTKNESRRLAKEFGEPEVLKGYGERMTTTMAIAPTTSSAFILGQVSQSIEPINSNYFVEDNAKGMFVYKNPYLIEKLKEKDRDEKSVWDSILIRGGSVQHLDFLSQEEKDVFKTFAEISQKEIIIQASIRQRFIDQGQSLNLTVSDKSDPREMKELIITAWEMGVKGLYYQRGANPAQELARSIMTCKSCEG